MTSKPLPPQRPPGSLDLLDAGANATPRDGTADPSWRADALGRSRHSRLASEVREPLDDADPERAERMCAEVTRDALGDFAPALLLLSADRRRRTQALTAWTVALFDFALRPGLAGLDGDRLAQINAWEFRTEEALDGNPPGQPVFVTMARENETRPWPREALDRVVAAARSAAVRNGDRGPDFAPAVLEALFAGPGSVESAESTRALAPLVVSAIAARAAGAVDSREAKEAAQAAQIANAPPGWRRAASYVKRRLRLGRMTLGLGGRVQLLIASALLPC